MRGLWVIACCLISLGAWAQDSATPNAAEEAAYSAAVHLKDPNVRIAKLDAFLSAYPISSRREEALLELMKGATEAHQIPKSLEAAKQIVQLDPNNVVALAVLAYWCANVESFGTPEQEDKRKSECTGYAEQGLKALDVYARPADLSEADFEHTKQETRAVFVQRIGTAALLKKDYARAQKFLQMAADTKPSEFSVIYPLALAYLNAPEPDCARGLWYVGRAISLAPDQNTKKSFAQFADNKAIAFNVDERTWSEIMSQAAKSQTPPAGFQITCSAK